VVLFECVTGKVPFEAETTWALVAKHLEEQPPDPRDSNPEVPGPLAVVIVKAMAKHPGDSVRIGSGNARRARAHRLDHTPANQG
jgi:hypothetical protein